MRLLPLTICSFLIVVTGCSTYVEDLASEDFLPVIPEEDASLNMVDGAIYSQQTPGLFATEKKANNVGDIVTISLNESVGLASASRPIFIQNSACALIERHMTALAMRTCS